MTSDGSANARIGAARITTGPRPRTGFTLVELLLAMGILAVVSVALHTAFATGVRLRLQARSRLDQVRALHDVAASLRDDLANLVSSRPNLAVDEARIVLLRHGRHGTDPTARDAAPSLVRYGWARRAGARLAFVRQETGLAPEELGAAGEMLRQAAAEPVLEPGSGSGAAGDSAPAGSWPPEAAGGGSVTEFSGLQGIRAEALARADTGFAVVHPGVQDSSQVLLRVTLATAALEGDLERGAIEPPLAPVGLMRLRADPRAASGDDSDDRTRVPRASGFLCTLQFPNSASNQFLP